MGKKSNVVLWVIIVILLLIIVGLGWYILDKKDNKTDNKQETKEKNTNNKEEKKLVYLSTVVNKYDGLYGIYEDGTVKLLTDNFAPGYHYTMDGNIVYYTNAKGDLFSFDITKPEEEHKAYDVKIEGTHFSVKDEKLYLINTVRADETKVYATTFDLKTGEEKKEELNVKVSHVDGNVYGTNFVFDDTVNVFDDHYFYSYDFATNKLTKYESYDQIYENREDYALFLGRNFAKYCVFDKKNVKELFCIDKDKNDQRVYSPIPTIHDGKLYYLSGNVIKECSSAVGCKDFYTLNDEESKAPYISFEYIGKAFLLTVGTNEKCDEGCAYDLTTYDINDNHKKMDYTLESGSYDLFLE